MSDKPTSLTGSAADSVVLLTRGIINTPAILAIVLLNVVMVAGWVWLFVQVSRARTAEMQSIITLLDDCVAAHMK